MAVIRAVDVLVNGNNGIAGRPAAGDIYLSAAASHSLMEKDIVEETASGTRRKGRRYKTACMDG